MRNIDIQTIKNTVRDLFLQSCISPGDDVTALLNKAYTYESNSLGKSIIKQIIDNNTIALKENTPACQDTGMAVVFIEAGREAYINGNISEAVNTGVREAYTEGYFRKSVVSPISRINTGNNTPAVIHYEITEGDTIRISVMPKGFGSENMSKLKMMKPSDGRQGIIDFVVSTAEEARANPCPPVFLGIGIGGTFDTVATLAKKALLADVLHDNTNPELAEMEREIKSRINALGLGPMGIGGDNYCLKANIMADYTHIAGLPVAVNYCCHILRRATKTI